MENQTMTAKAAMAELGIKTFRSLSAAITFCDDHGLKVYQGSARNPQVFCNSLDEIRAASACLLARQVTKGEFMRFFGITEDGRSRDDMLWDVRFEILKRLPEFRRDVLDSIQSIRKEKARETYRIVKEAMEENRRKADAEREEKERQAEEKRAAKQARKEEIKRMQEGMRDGSVFPEWHGLWAQDKKDYYLSKSFSIASLQKLVSGQQTVRIIIRRNKFRNGVSKRPVFQFVFAPNNIAKEWANEPFEWVRDASAVWNGSYYETPDGERLYTHEEVQRCIDGATSDAERGYTDNIVSDYV